MPHEANSQAGTDPSSAHDRVHSDTRPCAQILERALGRRAGFPLWRRHVAHVGKIWFQRLSVPNVAIADTGQCARDLIGIHHESPVSFDAQHRVATDHAMGT